MGIVVDKIIYIYSGILSENKVSAPRSPRQYHTLAIITEGELTNKVGVDSVVVRKNEILYIAPGCIDFSESNKECTYIAIEFSTLNNSDSHLLFGERVYSTEEDVYNDFRIILNMWNSDMIGKNLICFELLYRILSKIIKSTQKSTKQIIKYNKLSNAIAYINEHCFEQGFKISQLAEHCKLSAVHLNRLFVDLYGKTTSEYVSQKRIEHAKKLLMDMQYNISDIAFICGWSDVYTFSHAFKRMTKYSPTDWRNKL